MTDKTLHQESNLPTKESNGKRDLISIQKEHLNFLKKIRGREGIEEYDNSTLYLDSCISLLESELNPRNSRLDSISFNKTLVPNIEKLGFDNEESRAIACLLSNKRPVAVGELALVTEIERGKAYRTISKLLEYGMIIKSGIGLSRYVLANKLEPFQPMIDYITLQNSKRVEILHKFVILENQVQ